MNFELKSFRNFILFCSLIFSIFTAQGQRLKPKGFLGVAYEEASDSLMRSLRGLETHGILVKNVNEGTTAQRLGIRPNDVIVAINNIDSLYLYDFVELTKKLREGEPISITFVRDRRKARVIGTVTAMPREKSTFGEIIYDEVAFGRGYLRSIIQKPIGQNKFPAIFYMQDYGCNSIDFAADSTSPTKKLIEGWVKAGFLVFRVEKPGVGESEGTKACGSLTFGEELKAFENGFRTLKKNRYVDSTKVFLFGYGLGASIAPLIASKSGSKPRGIITYSATIKPFFEYMIDIFRERPQLFNESYQSIEANTRMITPLLHDWLVVGKTANELMQVPDFEAIMTSNENPLQYHKGTFMGRSPSFFSQLNEQNLVSAWAQAAVPTLAIHGEMDAEDIDPKAAQSIANIVNEITPNKGTFKLLKGTDHFFSKVGSFIEYEKQMKSGRYFRDYAPSRFNPEIIEMTVTWLKQN